MNVVKVMGGLGNQLFQYAFAKALEEQGDKVGIDISFYTDRENFDGKFLPREFELDRFNCEYTVTHKEYPVRITEDTYDPDATYKDTFFWGYWQRTYYFRHSKAYKQILKDISLKDQYITDEMKRIVAEMDSCNSVAVHVRRTDYIKMNWATNVQYYVDAREAIEKRVKDPKFYIFSDNINWCHDNLPFRDGQFIHMDEDVQDFYLMQQAKHNIIANSTYSFWAAYTNKHKNIVVAPKNWISGISWSPLDFEGGWILV